jgi:hypothetical protein
MGEKTISRIRLGIPMLWDKEQNDVKIETGKNSLSRGVKET